MINGFILKKEERLNEVNGVVKYYVHEKTNAQVYVIKNGDKEKSFNIGFKTLPSNDKGLPHILEHSVLCGSEKYPTKEPFVELLKGSFNSFLNAETFADKTLYPLSSTNDKDFCNQAGVYLDAVFFPNLLKDDKIMQQEGWHYEIGEDGELTYNGVVYNEMKGAYSQPSRLLDIALTRALFQNVYGQESGGDPDAIPQLTQEEFRAFHKRFYNPSNSVTCLYGDVDEESLLSLLASYFDRFEKCATDNIDIQKPTGKLVRVDNDFEISPTEDEKTKAMLSVAFVCGNVNDIKTTTATGILCDMLSSEASPLKIALRKAQLGQSIKISFDDFSLQPLLTITADGTDESRVEEFKKIVFDELTKMSKGIDEKLVTAAINQHEFALKKGAIWGMSKGMFATHFVINAALFDVDVFKTLANGKTTAEIKEDAKHGLFENLISKFMLNSNHSAIGVLHPKKGIGAQKTEQEKAKMRALRESLTAEQLEEIKSSVAALKLKQSTPDTPEALATISRLQVSEIDKKQSFLSYEKKAKALWLDVFSDGIANVNFVFSLDRIAKEDLPYAALLSSVFAMTDTAKRNYLDLTNELGIYVGDIDSSCNFYAGKADVIPTFEINTAMLDENVEKGFQLVAEIVSSSRFDDKVRLKEIVATEFNNQMMSAIGAGHAASLRRVLSYVSKSGWCADQTKGLGYFFFLKDIYQNFDEKIDVVIAKLKDVASKIFTSGNMQVFVAGQQKELDVVSSHVEIVEKALGKETKQQKWDINPQALNEAFTCPSQVQYNGLGNVLQNVGEEISGYLKVSKNLVSTDYLWNKIRVLGGAYGALMLLSDNGAMVFVTYRDPKLKETFETYAKLPEYLRSLQCDDAELTKSIIGTVSEIDAPLTPKAAASVALANFLQDETQKEAQKIRDEILSCKQKDLRATADVYEKIIKTNCLCTIGNAQKIEENKDVFAVVKNLA